MTVETVFSTPWFSIEAITLPGGDPAALPYYSFTAQNGALVVPVTPAGELVLIRQYRPVLGRWTLEFPAGGVDPGETAETAIARELLEETGYRCAELMEVYQGPLRPERETMTNHFFLGVGAERLPGPSVEKEFDVVLLTPKAFREEVLAGRFDHVAALPVLTLAQWRFGFTLPGL
ncbi:NUDIX hydrolase [Rhodospirillum sp. A1_3_36]|uniref:NUDIX hydrolase n=1 Tax=Rhodospirillum sp. A1_3_36 TaxID=3391666 RepID=UPI0039A62171